MPIGTNPSNTYKNMTASTLLKSGQGVLAGFVVSSTTSGTVTIYDSATAATSTDIMLGTITPAAGSTYKLDAAFANGCYIVCANTINLTAYYV